MQLHWPDDSQQFAAELGLKFLQIHPTLGSTNDHAAKLAEAGPVGTPGAVVAVRQTAGKGQAQNSWYADAGSLAATLMFDACLHLAPNQIPLRTGLAVREVVATYLPKQSVQIKWPNDILVDGKKIAGILCQRIKQIDLLGIGINIATDLSQTSLKVQSRATSMGAYHTALPPVSQIFAELYHALSCSLVANDWHEKFRQYDALLGQQISVYDGEQRVVGQCHGVDEQGRLVVTQQGVRHALITGRQVQLV